MAGVIWFKQGKHWSRSPVPTEISADINAKLIRALCRLPDRRMSNTSHLHTRKGIRQVSAMHWRLLDAVAMAHHWHQVATTRTATRKDAERQLKAMLQLDDAGMAKAIDDCDTGTRAAISKAQNAIDQTPEARWIQSDDPNAMPGTLILAPETVRRSIAIAFSNVQAANAPRGRKEKPYQLDLAKTCHAFWSECQPKGAPGRLEFVRTLFEAADIHLGDKSIEALITKAMRSCRKSGRIK